MSGETLLALAERCERASGPDRELDAAIAAALGWRKVPNPTSAGGLIDAWLNPDGQQVRWALSLYTASLDAAMTLVPEGMAFLLDWLRYDGKGERPIYWEAFVQWIDDAVNRGNAEATTPALALCAAALRARTHQETSNDPA